MAVIEQSDRLRRDIGLTPIRPPRDLALGPARELLVTRSVGAAYEPDGRLAVDTIRTGAELERLPGRLPEPTVVATHDDPVVWGGGLFGHHGHFLVECTSRLWPLLPGAPLHGLAGVFSTPRRNPRIYEWLDAFGAPRIALPPRGTIRFGQMHVPEPAWRLDRWATPEVRQIHLHARRGLRLPPTPRCDVLWLSRSRLHRIRAPYDERLLEWVLDRHVRRIHPETMTLAAQVAAIEAADAVAGVIGSAFHTLLLARELPRCVYLCPTPTTTHGAGGIFLPNHTTQDRILDTRAELVYACAFTGPREDRFRDGRRMNFPGGYRMLIPEALRGLRRTVLPGLFDDPRAFALAHPGQVRSRGGLRGAEQKIQMAAARVLLSPRSIDARTALATLFESEGQGRCAVEQHMAVAHLAGSPVRPLLRAARIASRAGDAPEASAIARLALIADPESSEATQYVRAGGD